MLRCPAIVVILDATTRVVQVLENSKENTKFLSSQLNVGSENVTLQWLSVLTIHRHPQSQRPGDSASKYAFSVFV